MSHPLPLCLFSPFRHREWHRFAHFAATFPLLQYDVFGHNASLFADGYLDFINSDICAFFETACEEFICEAAGCDRCS